MAVRSIIDPSGDLVLRLNITSQDKTSHDDESPKRIKLRRRTNNPLEKELLVSAKVLSIVSPVFSAMLEGPFSEALALSASKTAGTPFELPLPEDDALAMEILCKLAHFNMEGVPEIPSLKLLETLAFLCDKYQCPSALRYCGSIWTRKRLESYRSYEKPETHGSKVILMDHESLLSMLVFTYAVGLHVEFADTVWCLFIHHRGPLSKKLSLNQHALLPKGLIGQLNLRRFQLFGIFHRAMMTPFTGWLCYTWDFQGSRSAGKKNLEHYAALLRQNHLSSADANFSEHGLGDLLHGAKCLQFLDTSTTWNIKTPTSESSGRGKFDDEIQRAIVRIESCRQWLGCLDCIEAACTGQKAPTKCTIPHVDIGEYVPGYHTFPKAGKH